MCFILSSTSAGEEGYPAAATERVDIYIYIYIYMYNNILYARRRRRRRRSRVDLAYGVSVCVMRIIHNNNIPI
jgi:hypothetical protein